MAAAHPNTNPVSEGPAGLREEAKIPLFRKWLSTSPAGTVAVATEQVGIVEHDRLALLSALQPFPAQLQSLEADKSRRLRGKDLFAERRLALQRTAVQQVTTHLITLAESPRERGVFEANFERLGGLILTQLEKEEVRSCEQTRTLLYQMGTTIGEVYKGHMAKMGKTDACLLARWDRVLASAAPQPSCFSWWCRAASTEVGAATPLIR